jgi:hypothetical protein
MIRGWLKTLLGGRQRRKGREIGRLHEKLEAFTRPSLALVDSRELSIPAQRERYATYLYGAATALAASRELGETESLALLVRLLRSGATMALQEREVSHLVGRAMTLAHELEGSRVYDAGGAAMAEWLAGNAASAVRGLAQVIRGVRL